MVRTYNTDAVSQQKKRPPKIEGEKWRLSRTMAHRGPWSRRQAEVLILGGKVQVGGKTIQTLGTPISPFEAISVEGRTLPPMPALRLWGYHKTTGLVVTHNDPQERTTVFEALPKPLRKEAGQLFSVGRLDINSEGLLLLTNHGALQRFLESPENRLTRVYRVRIQGIPEERALDALSQGVRIQGIYYDPVQAYVLRSGQSNSWLEMHLQQGKNREIRKLCEAFGWRVNRLIRESYGPWELGSLPQGAAFAADLRLLPQSFWQQFPQEMQECSA